MATNLVNRFDFRKKQSEESCLNFLIDQAFTNLTSCVCRNRKNRNQEVPRLLLVKSSSRSRKPRLSQLLKKLRARLSKIAGERHTVRRTLKMFWRDWNRGNPVSQETQTVVGVIAIHACSTFMRTRWRCIKSWRKNSSLLNWNSKKTEWLIDLLKT